MKIRPLFPLIVLLIPVIFCSCMKSRYQLRAEGKEEVQDARQMKGAPAPAPEQARPPVEYLVEEMKSELTHMAGRIEDLERLHKPGTEGQDGESVTARLTGLEQSVLALSEKVAKNESIVKETPSVVLKEAERLFKEKNYKKAIIEFSKFPEKYSSSKHMPQALYQIARSFEALGMKSDARGFYQELVEKYPKSSQGKRSRKKAK